MQFAKFSPDGRRIATAAGDGTVRIWRTFGATGKAGLRKIMSRARIQQFSGLPDGRHGLAVVDSDRGRECGIIDLETGKTVHDLAEAGERVLSAGHSDNGRYIATIAEDQVLRIVDTATRKVVKRRKNPSNSPPLALRQYVRGSVANDASFVFVQHGSIGAVQFVDTDSGVIPLELPRGRAMRYSISSDARSIVTADLERNTATIYDVRTGKIRGTLTGHTGYVMDAAFSHDQKSIATTAVDSSIGIWDAESGRQKERISGLPMCEGAVEWSMDDKLLLFGSERDFRIYDFQTRDWKLVLPVGSSHHGMGFTLDGRWAWCLRAGVTRFWPIDPVAWALENPPRPLSAAEADLYEVGTPEWRHGLAEQLAQSSPSAWVLYRSGMVALDRGDDAVAMQSFERSVALRPLLWCGHYGRACALIKAGRRAEALDALERALATGYQSTATLAQDARLASLRQDPRFEAILAGSRTAPPR